MEKSDFRKYANQETIVCETEKNEDGGVDYYYEDDSWDIEPDMLQDYANDYVKCNVKFGRSGNNIEYGSGTIFEIQKNTNHFIYDISKAKRELKFKPKIRISKKVLKPLLENFENHLS